MRNHNLFADRMHCMIGADIIVRKNQKGIIVKAPRLKKKVPKERSLFIPEFLQKKW